ncbi:UDP-N-acetylenolpyruvoylglucosamine reductase, partial [Bienertia sinuspersici]
FVVASRIQLPQHDSCCKTSSTFRLLNAITASLYPSSLSGFMLCLQQLACICSIVACLIGSEELEDLSQCLNCISDTVQCTVCACMQTQHKLELDKRDGIIEAFPAMEVPKAQQMSRTDPNAPP